jgi:Zn-finger nucleic acid-binding protein
LATDLICPKCQGQASIPNPFKDHDDDDDRRRSGEGSQKRRKKSFLDELFD